MTRRINKVAILGSGIMGSGIACHFANIGVEVLLLDIVPRELNEAEKAQGLTLETPAVRNRIVNDFLAAALKSKPSPIYRQSFASRITTGNFDDNMKDIATCDWIIEVVIERLDIKKIVFDNVEKFRKPGTIVTSNTSGIPIQQMLDGRSEDFAKNFCGTHFFNPPRYLKLFEIIPSTKTDPELVAFLADYAPRFLGKTAVLCKDTPAFIANRIGVYSIMALFHSIKELGMSIDEVDKLTGPVFGRPKSATFRTCDVVGLDTLVHVANGLKEGVPNDECNNLFDIPDYVQKMIENKWLGSKTKQGFFKRETIDGKKVTMSLDLNTMEYKPSEKVKFQILDIVKPIDDLVKRVPMLMGSKDKAGDFYRKTTYPVLKYVSNRIPEISDELFKIDDGMVAGFGWELGPFQLWDAIGVAKTVKAMEEAGLKPAQWVYDMLAAGCETFYKVENGKSMYYDIQAKGYKVIPGTEELLSLANLRATNVLWENAGSTIFDLGDGILCFEAHTKMNTIGEDVINGLNKCIDMAEKDYKGVVIYNEGANFSAGADVSMIFSLAVEQEFDELNFAVSLFQNTMMRLRYSSIPVVAAPHGLALGGGCEMCMHTDKVVMFAETYMGLVEFGVGLIPGGGGTKEFALRLSDELKTGDIRTNAFINRFMTVGSAKVGMSGYEAFDLGYLRPGVDEIIVSRVHQLKYAKDACLLIANKGYSKPPARKDIKVLGSEGVGLVLVGADGLTEGGFMSEHDKLIAEKLGYVLAGGDISQALTEVTEQYLLDLERKTFLELCRTRKTLERMESLIKSGKILRN